MTVQTSVALLMHFELMWYSTIGVVCNFWTSTKDSVLLQFWKKRAEIGQPLEVEP